MIVVMLACVDGPPDKPDTQAPDTTDTETTDSCMPVTWYVDGDADGAGGSETVEACDAPDGYVATGADCDDADPTRSPLLAEVCDPADVDEDCSGAADDDDEGVSDATTWYRDYDGDGYATGEGQTIVQCDEPAGFTSVSGDCDDEDETIHPDATEVCDDADTDEDCDGLADDADDSVDPTTFTDLHTDADGDGYGSAEIGGARCDETDGLVDNMEDCDDTDATVGTASPWYLDADGDGYGDTEVEACEAPPGYVADGGDCDDADPDRSPAATEVCLDLFDQDCDGYTDEYTGVCEPVVNGAAADLCDTVTPADASDCTSGIAAILSSGASYTTVDDALLFAAAGDVVTVCPGRWAEALSVNVSPLAIAGFGDGTSVLMPGSDVGITVGVGVELTITGLTIEGAEEKHGAAVYIEEGASVCVSSSEFGLNEAERKGGAFYVADTASLVLDVTTFYANAGDQGGAVTLDGEGTLVIEDSTFVLNEAGSYGGGLAATAGTVALDNLVFDENTSQQGGAISFEGTELAITATTFTDNVGATMGGAILVDDVGVLVGESVEFLDNASQEGGAVAFEGTELSMSATTFSGNAATLRGGAVFVDNIANSMTVACDTCVFEYNDATDGGALLLSETNFGSTLNMTDSTFTGNVAVDGGVVQVRQENWDLAFESCAFTGNDATDEGGVLHLGVSAGGHVAFDTCSVTSNTASEGGGVFLAETTATVLTSTDSDWGEGADDNTPADVNVYSYGSAATFTCTWDTCE
ncbi:MAG: MopE-related protein [Myxococcota bacterium]